MFPDSKRPELLMSLTAVLLLVIWHFGRSLGLSRTCRERNTINVNILVVDIHRYTSVTSTFELRITQISISASKCSPRKPARGSLRLSRRQGDRNRAIRVQQEPLRFYEEASAERELHDCRATQNRKRQGNQAEKATTECTY